MKNIFDKFNGIKPIMDADLLPASYAQTAHNLKLDSGKITTCLESLAEFALPDANRNSIYKYKIAGHPLICGVSGTLAAFQEVKNGAFGISVGGTTYQVNSCDFSECASKTDIAVVLQARLRLATGGMETVTYDAITDKFTVITSQSTIGYMTDTTWNASVNFLPTMTSNITPSGIVSANAELYGNSAWKFADASLTTKWEGYFYGGTSSATYHGSPCWWQYKDTGKKVVTSFRIYTGSTSNLYDIYKFTLQGSNDGVTFTELGSYTNNTHTINTWNTYTVASGNQAPYQYHRINITQTYASDSEHIGFHTYLYEIEFFASATNIAISTYLNGKTGTATLGATVNTKTWLSWASNDIDVVKALSDEDNYRRIYWTGDNDHVNKLMVYGDLPNAPTTREVGGIAPASVGTPTVTHVIGTTDATYMRGATCSCAVTGALSATVACPLKSFEKTPTGYIYVFRFPETIATGTIDTGTVIAPAITFPTIGAKTTADVGKVAADLTYGGVHVGNFQLESISDNGIINAVNRISSTSTTNYGHTEYYNHDIPSAGVDTIAVQNGTANVATATFTTSYTISPFDITVVVNMNWLINGASYAYYYMAWVNDMGEVSPLSPISALVKKDSDQIVVISAIPANAVAFTDAGDLVTMVAHGLPSGFPVKFLTVVSTTGITANTQYYVVNPTANTFQVATAVGGTPLTLTTNGTGTLDYLLYPKKRIYRSATGTNTAEFRFLTELDNSATTYTDTTRDADLGEVMPVRENPPEGLRGICAHPGNFGVGFVGRQVWFTEVGLMATWPSKYMMTTDDDVVGISVNGNDIHVVTTGYPEVISGNSPDTLYKAKMLMAYPCVSKRSIKRWGTYTVFTSKDGLVILQGGSGKLFTESIYNPLQWALLHPELALGEVYGDKYYMFVNYGGSNNCIIFSKENIVTNDEFASGSFVDLSEGEMYLIDGANIMKFERGDTAKQWIWKSKEFHDMKPWSPAWFRITPNGSVLNAAFNMYAEGVLSATSSVTEQGAYRLPITRLERKHSYEIVSSQAVDWFGVSENSRELQR